MSANAKQEGGSHYAGDYQWWDFVRDARLDYFAGNAGKYIIRKKGDIKEDIKKAIHYVEKMIESGQHPPMDRPDPLELSTKFYRITETYRLGHQQQIILRILCVWKNHDDLLTAIYHMNLLLDYYS